MIILIFQAKLHLKGKGVSEPRHCWVARLIDCSPGSLEVVTHQEGTEADPWFSRVTLHFQPLPRPSFGKPLNENVATLEQTLDLFGETMQGARTTGVACVAMTSYYLMSSSKNLGSLKGLVSLNKYFLDPRQVPGALQRLHLSDLFISVWGVGVRVK